MTSSPTTEKVIPYALLGMTTLLQGPSAFWSVGASAAAAIFDGGRRHALSDEAKAAYDSSVASYRQAVLSAFQQVEDNLAAYRDQPGNVRQEQGSALHRRCRCYQTDYGCGSPQGHAGRQIPARVEIDRSRLRQCAKSRKAVNDYELVVGTNFTQSDMTAEPQMALDATIRF